GLGGQPAQLARVGIGGRDVDPPPHGPDGAGVVALQEAPVAAHVQRGRPRGRHLRPRRDLHPRLGEAPLGPPLLRPPRRRRPPPPAGGVGALPTRPPPGPAAPPAAANSTTAAAPAPAAAAVAAARVT